MANCVNQCKKLRIYAKFKTDIKFENNLDSVTDFTIRHNLTQFRLGVHDLEIERGRYGHKPSPIEERYCKLCLDMRIQAVEDEPACFVCATLWLMRENTTRFTYQSDELYHIMK